MTEELDTTQLADLLPEYLSQDEQMGAFLEALDGELNALAAHVDAPAIYARLDALAGAVLDHLARQYDIAVWRDTWPDDLKRDVLRAAIPNMRKRGTRAAIVDAVASVRAGAEIVEWWQETPKGTPHTFKINVHQAALEGVVASEMLADLRALIDDAKPARTRYTLSVLQPLSGQVNASGVLRAATFARVESSGTYGELLTGSLAVGAVARGVTMVHLIGAES